ncbi:hypothetical protein PENTCL1PPCAC_22718, partial [Pristionchus entomophagus]
RTLLILYAIITRAVVFLLQLVFSSFDFSTDAFKGPQEREGWVGRMFRGFSRWDSLQFLHIAKYGYTYEHSLAFFPFFPTVIRTGSSLLSTVSTGVIVSPDSIVIAAVLLNFVTFIISSILIYDISFTITSSVKISLISFFLFSINPASIFFSSIYTESVYCCLTLLGIRLLLSSRSSVLTLPLTTLLFSCSLLTRSNGLLNIGYIVFYDGLRLFGPRRDRLWDRNIGVQMFKIGAYLIRIGTAIVIIVLTLRVHSIRQRIRFCSETPKYLPQSIVEFGQEQNLKIVGTHVPWCSETSLVYPSFYSSIQDRFWDVSCFGYWKIQKIPCFLLAIPSLFFTFYCASRVINRLMHNGLEWLMNSHGDSLPFAIHSITLAIPALLIYNVEVFTRIVFSSSPFLYIELARIIHERTPNVASEDLGKPRMFPFLPYLLYRRDICCLISTYFFLYYSLGTAMHSSFLPFT